MALYRENPKCPECGISINGKYNEMSHDFCGDTWYGWDWESHVCRLGTRYFIERTDENKWWNGSGWTNDTTDAMLWELELEAKKYLTDTMLIAPRIPCVVTEHEFVESVQEGGEK